MSTTNVAHTRPVTSNFTMHSAQSGQQTPDGWIITGTDRKNDLVDQ